MRQRRIEASVRRGKRRTAAAVLAVAVTAASVLTGAASIALAEPAFAHLQQVQSGSAAPPVQPADPGAARPEPDLRRHSPPDAQRSAPRDNGQREDDSDHDGPGCPANQRPLELLV